jgi:hypothetical protein
MRYIVNCSTLLIEFRSSNNGTVKMYITDKVMIERDKSGNSFFPGDIVGKLFFNLNRINYSDSTISSSIPSRTRLRSSTRKPSSKTLLLIRLPLIPKHNRLR